MPAVLVAVVLRLGYSAKASWRIPWLRLPFVRPLLYYYNVFRSLLVSRSISRSIFHVLAFGECYYT